MRVIKIKKQVPIASMLYFTSFLGLFFCRFYSTTTFIALASVGMLWNLWRIYSIIAIGCKIVLFDNYSVGRLVIAAAFVLIGVVAYYNSGRGNLLDVIILTVGSSGINYKKILRNYLIWASLFLCITFLCSISGVIIDYVTYRPENGNMRHSFGVIYATDFAAHAFFIYLTYFVLEFEKKKKRIVMIASSLLLVYLLDFYCDARLSELSILLTCFLFLLVDIWPRLLSGEWIKRCVCVAFPACSLFSVLVTILYNGNNSKWMWVDEALFSNRLKVANRVIANWGVKMFGQPLMMQGMGYSTVKFDTSIGITYLDSSYVQILVVYGLIMFVFIVLLFTVFTKYVSDENNKALMISAVILAINCIINQYLIDVAYNPFVLVMGSYIWKRCAPQESPKRQQSIKRTSSRRRFLA